jgi:hypothetical protein
MVVPNRCLFNRTLTKDRLAVFVLGPDPPADRTHDIDMDRGGNASPASTHSSAVATGPTPPGDMR